jgi:hypothetical protein
MGAAVLDSMSRKIKIHETHAFEVYDALSRLRDKVARIDFGYKDGMPAKGWAEAVRERDARLDEWDRSALGRFYHFLRKKLN